MSKFKLKKGQLLLITFLDHVEGGDDVLEFQTLGRVYAVDRWKVVLDTWFYSEKQEETLEEDDRSENVGRYTIVRSAIQKVEPLVVA